MPVKIQIRRDTASNWSSNNPTLSLGELGFVIDTSQLKIGDGSTLWNSLPYFLNSASATTAEIAAAVADLIDLSPETLDTLNELAAAIGDDANFFQTIGASVTSASAYALSEANLYTDTEVAEAIVTASAAAVAYADGLTTSDVSEGTNLYFTNQRAINSGSATYAPISSPTFTGTVNIPTLNLTNALPISEGGTGQTTSNSAFNSLVPSQSGNSGKYLTTDGTNTSWATVTGGGGGGTSSGGAGVTFIKTGTFSSVSSFSLDQNTFNSTYHNYRIIVRVDSSSLSNTLRLRLRKNNTDVTSGNYYVSEINGSNRSNDYFVLNESEYLAENGQFYVCELYGPQSSVNTYLSALSYGFTNGSNQRNNMYGGVHVPYGEYDFDSCTFYTNSGIVSGTYYVYGYDKASYTVTVSDDTIFKAQLFFGGIS